MIQENKFKYSNLLYNRNKYRTDRIKTSDNRTKIATDRNKYCKNRIKYYANRIKTITDRINYCSDRSKITGNRSKIKEQPMDKRNKLTDRMLKYGTLLNNSIGLQDILAATSLYGYDYASLQSALLILDEINELNNLQAVERGEQSQAYQNFDLAYKQAYKLYIRNLRIARIVFAENKEACIALMLDGDRKQSFSGWQNQANAFYANLLNNESYLETAAGMNISKQQLMDEFKAVQNLSNLTNICQKEKGEAVQSTKNRDEKVELIDKFCKDFIKICKIIFEDSPETLIKIGIGR